MRVLAASDSFKGSLSSSDFIKAIQHAAARIGNIEVWGIPVADGGEGTLSALLEPLDGKLMACEVTDPLGRKITSHFGLAGRTAIIEMARCAGLTLLAKEERNPLYTTSYGLGEMIRYALDNPVIEEIVIAIGGSATCDGGVGMAQALGVGVLNARNEQIGYGGVHVGEIARIDMQHVHPRLREVSIRALCDVFNPLCGDNGAAAVYGPQKGASRDMVDLLDENLGHLAGIIHRYLDKDILNVPGAGAAGGAGAALMAFCNAQLKPGIDVLLDVFNFDDKITSVDLIITGEGRTDAQTACGKAVAGVARRAKKYARPVVCLSGAIGNVEPLYDLGVDCFFSICPGPVSEEYAMQNAYSLVVSAAENILRLYQKGMAPDNSHFTP